MKGYFEKMRKFVLAFGVPVLAVASLIGSGYATWYFNSDVSTNYKDIALELKEKRVVGAEFKHIASEDFKLVLDQPVKNDGMPTGRLGVHFEGTFTESLAANDGGANKFVKGTSYTATTKITIPSAVAKYVKFTLDGQTSSADSTDDSTLTKVDDSLKVVGEDQSTFDVFNISEVDVEYTTNEPKNSAEYDAMQTALENQTIRISFEAKIDTK